MTESESVALPLGDTPISKCLYSLSNNLFFCKRFCFVLLKFLNFFLRGIGSVCEFVKNLFVKIYFKLKLPRPIFGGREFCIEIKLFFHTLFENSRKYCGKQGGGDDCGGNVCGGFRVKNCLHAPEIRQNEDTTQKDDQLSRHREQNGISRLSEGGQSVYEGVLEGEGNGSRHKNADTPDALLCNVGRLREERNEGGCEKEGEKCHQRGVADTQEKYVFFCAADVGCHACAVVVAENGLGARADAQQGHGEQLKKRLYDGGNGDPFVRIGASVLF